MLIRVIFSFIACFLFLVNPEGRAQQPAPAKVKKMAILPTLTYLNKDVLREGIDSVSWYNIQRSEAYNSQNRNYFVLTQKRLNSNVMVQPFAQTNALLEQAGISYAALAEMKHEELAGLLGVDLVFYGVNYRIADPHTPEERMALRLAASVLLPPLIASTAQARDKPITTIHYLLYDSYFNKTVWHYKDETTRPDTQYISSLKQFLTTSYPIRR